MTSRQLPLGTRTCRRGCCTGCRSSSWACWSSSVICADAAHAADPPGRDQAGAVAADRLGRHRRLRRGQGGAARGRRLPARPQALPRLGAEVPEGHPALRAARAPARRCWPRRSPTSPARPSSRSPRRRSSRCSPALGAARIRRLFRIARKHAPAIVFIDELDAVGGHRGIDTASERDQTLNQLLVEMDGFTCTRRRGRDRGLQPAREARPGAAAARAASTARSSSRPPDVVGRERILAGPFAQQAARPTTSTSTLLARQTSGLTGADLANICNEAAIFAARRGGQSSGDGRLRRRARAGRRRHAVAPHADRPRAARSSPTTRPATRCAASCCPRSTACTGSRSSPAAARSATRSTSPRRIAT